MEGDGREMKDGEVLEVEGKVVGEAEGLEEAEDVPHLQRRRRSLHGGRVPVAEGRGAPPHPLRVLDEALVRVPHYPSQQIHHQSLQDSGERELIPLGYLVRPV